MASSYPSRSHTFIRREIEELENNGLQVLRFSQRKFSPSEIISKLDQKEFDLTYSIFPIAWISLLYCHFCSLLKKPGRYFSCLLECFSRRPVGFTGPAYALSYFTQGIYLSKQLDENDIRFLHIHFVNSGYQIGVTAAAYLDIAWGTSVHGRSDFDYPGVRLLIHAISGGKFLRCISQYGASQAMRQCPAELWHKIFVCYSGIPDSTIIQHNVSVIRNPQQQFRLVVVGRLSEEKGQVLMLHAVQQLKLDGYDFRVSFVGDGPDQKILEDMVKVLDLSDVCIFTGAVSEQDVYSALKNADLLVCPSLMEGLPQVLMESMSVHKPVVAPYLAGIPELIENRFSGILYHCGSWENLAESIALLFRDRNLYQKCSKNGFDTIKEKYVISKTIIPLLEKLKLEI